MTKLHREKEVISGKTEAQFWSNIRHNCETMLLKLGIHHNDLHLGNMLWCDQPRAIVPIDFERARFVKSGAKCQESCTCVAQLRRECADAMAV